VGEIFKLKLAEQSQNEDHRIKQKASKKKKMGSQEN
jgi:hypothetical protein